MPERLQRETSKAYYTIKLFDPAGSRFWWINMCLRALHKMYAKCPTNSVQIVESVKYDLFQPADQRLLPFPCVQFFTGDLMQCG